MDKDKRTLAQQLRQKHPTLSQEDLRRLAFGSEPQHAAWRYYEGLRGQGLSHDEASRRLMWWWDAEYDEPASEPVAGSVGQQT